VVPSAVPHARDEHLGIDREDVRSASLYPAVVPHPAPIKRTRQWLSIVDDPLWQHARLCARRRGGSTQPVAACAVVAASLSGLLCCTMQNAPPCRASATTHPPTGAPRLGSADHSKHCGTVDGAQPSYVHSVVLGAAPTTGPALVMLARGYLQGTLASSLTSPLGNVLAMGHVSPV
jgi:hypothetical protein